MLCFMEYIWMDGASPTQKLRSKSRLVEIESPDTVQLEDFPEWSFDGSSTYQADGDSSDLVLKPASFVRNPLRKDGSCLVMCEVFDSEGNPHKSNSRAELRRVLDAGQKRALVWF